MIYKCDFCGKEIHIKMVLKDSNLEKKDGTDITLCLDCLNAYVNGDYNKIKLKGEKFKDDRL
jgi:hypothetical protein